MPGLRGQLLFASIIPLPGNASYENMIGELADPYVTHNEHGLIRMKYETMVCVNKEIQ